MILLTIFPNRSLRSFVFCAFNILIPFPEEREENESLQRAAAERSKDAFQRQMENIHTFDEKFDVQRKTNLQDAEVTLRN